MIREGTLVGLAALDPPYKRPTYRQVLTRRAGRVPARQVFFRAHFLVSLDGLKLPGRFPMQPRCQRCQVNCGGDDFRMLSNEDMMYR